MGPLQFKWYNVALLAFSHFFFNLQFIRMIISRHPQVSFAAALPSNCVVIFVESLNCVTFTYGGGSRERSMIPQDRGSWHQLSERTFSSKNWYECCSRDIHLSSFYRFPFDHMSLKIGICFDLISLLRVLQHLHSSLDNIPYH